MILLKFLIALIAVHIGLGFAQLSTDYFIADVPNAAGGSVSHTPVGNLINLQTDPEQRQSNWKDPRTIWNVLDEAGDAINGLVSFDYPMLDLIVQQGDSGLAYNVIVILRLIGTLFSVALGLGFLLMLFQSNILTSKLGFGLVVFGAGSTVVTSAIGAITGG